MKIRMGFVSNSSSCSFTITNTSSETKTLVDFVKETPWLLQQFLGQYCWNKEYPEMNQEQLILDAEAHPEQFDPGESRVVIFGDEDGTTIGRVYDYIL